MPKHTVSTADFSVPAPPLPLEVDDAQSIVKAAPLATAGHDANRARSRGWFVIGIVAGLALSSVVWRRWRESGEPQHEAQAEETGSAA